MGHGSRVAAARLGQRVTGVSETPQPDRSAVKAMFFRAIELPPQEREAFLADACGSDPQMRNEVASLLAAHEDGLPFLDALPFEGAVPALRDALQDPDGRGITLPTGTRIGHYEVLEPLSTLR